MDGQKGTDMKNANIDLTIDQLVLEGIDPRYGQRVGQALQAELTRLFQKRGIPDAFSKQIDVQAIDAGALQANPTNSPDLIGIQIAQSLYSGLSNKTK